MRRSVTFSDGHWSGRRKCKRGRRVYAILKSLEALNGNENAILVSEICDDPAHELEGLAFRTAPDSRK
jgi:hypothetical protein